MALIDLVLGNSDEVSIEQIQPEIAHLLTPNETLHAAFRAVRDLMVFTNKRLIMIDKTGLSGNKMNIVSIKYSQISHYVIETGGTLDLETVLLIYPIGDTMPKRKSFKKSNVIYKVQYLLALFTLQ